jgi:hypothetical protein
MSEGIGTIRGDIEFEDGVVEFRESLDDWSAGLSVPGSTMMIPSELSLTPSSASLHSMPSLGTPPIARRSSAKPTPGRFAPMPARTTSPGGAGTLGAPQTTVCSRPLPRSTVTRCRLLRVGCGSIRRTCAITQASNLPEKSSTPSTAKPMSVRCSATTAASFARVGSNSRSQRSETRIVADS